ncbi:hypothetical protein GCM10023318_19820 [Nocardia callitridis]|uniref:Uncharacterized protein n=1 Tax=Nocardia callitridis TaxID=648753 RepID=A0ABP9K2R7_9NOCA
MCQRGQPRPSAGANVDGGTRDRTGGGDTTEQWRGDIRQALAEQFAVGVVARADRHGVRRGRRKQRLEGGQRRDGQRGRDQRPELVEVQKPDRRRR